MKKISTRQTTLASTIEFGGFGVHGGLPVTLILEPAPADTGYLITRIFDDGTAVGPVQVHFSRVARTALCTTIDIGESTSVSTIEHVMSALSGLGVDNVKMTVKGPEFPILDGSSKPFCEGIVSAGVRILPSERKFIQVKRQVTVRNNDAFAALEPYNGRALDIEIDFDSQVIGRERMIFDWTPRHYVEDVSAARTFGFVHQAKILRQAGFALGSSLENSIAVEDGKILNPGGLRYEDEFVRHKLLDAVGDLALAGLPIYGRFRSYKGGHALNALVLSGLFASTANYEIVSAEDLPLVFDGLEDLPDGLDVDSYLRSVS